MVITYDRPVTARLTVTLDNGETFDPTPDDLAKFGYIQKHDTYRFAEDALNEAMEPLNLDSTDAYVSVFRRLIEMACFYQHIYDEGREHRGNLKALIRNITGIEVALTAALVCSECGGTVALAGESDGGDQYGFMCSEDVSHVWNLSTLSAVKATADDSEGGE